MAATFGLGFRSLTPGSADSTRGFTTPPLTGFRSGFSPEGGVIKPRVKSSEPGVDSVDGGHSRRSHAVNVIFVPEPLRELIGDGLP
jgi:hypothetical protein